MLIVNSSEEIFHSLSISLKQINIIVKFEPLILILIFILFHFHIMVVISFRLKRCKNTHQLVLVRWLCHQNGVVPFIIVILQLIVLVLFINLFH